MRREKVGKVVAIGNGLCRVIVRSEKLAEQLRQIPGVEVRGEDAEHLGWWIIFPEELRRVIEPVFRHEARTIVTRAPAQLSLFDEPPTDAEGRGQSPAEGPNQPSGEGDDAPRA